MEYLVNSSRYTLHYSHLRADYLRYKEMEDEEFLQNLIPILQFCLSSLLF